MTKPAPENAQEVLFVGLTAGELPVGLASRLAARGTPASYCGDVYRALARIGKRPPAAVVAAVDWLSAPELEFFEILARSHAERPVYVVGAARARGKIDRAVACGASGLATLDEFVAELSPCAAEAADSTPSVDLSPPPASPPRERGDIPFAPTGNVFDAELDRRLSEAAESVASETDDFDDPSDLPERAGRMFDEGDDASDDLSDDHTDTPVRVPWLTYESSPRRIPPTRVPPNGDSVEPETPKDADDDPPLLTPEELEALLADDDDPTQYET